MTTSARFESTTPAGRLRARVQAARRRVDSETPFSPSWDAAMAALEDADREVWRFEKGTIPTR
jgi:hypothetical protein